MSPYELQNSALRKWIDDILRVSGLSATELLTGIEAMRKDATRWVFLRDDLGMYQDNIHPCDQHRSAEIADEQVDRMMGVSR
jgi:hypothetical protein